MTPIDSTDPNVLPETPSPTTEPDVVLIDLQVPIRNGVTLVRHVGETCPRASIVTRVRLRSGATACFRVEVLDGSLRLSPDDPPRVPPTGDTHGGRR